MKTEPTHRSTPRQPCYWMAEAAMLDAIRRRVQMDGSQKMTARALGVSPQFLCDVLKGRRDISAALAESLGYQRIVVFVQDTELARAIRASAKGSKNG